MTNTFTLDDIKDAASRIHAYIVRTPTVSLKQSGLKDLLPKNCTTTLKLELLQMSGSFKARGNLLSLMALTSDQLENGVTAASGGNHALALAWAAKTLGTTAKIAIPKSADPIRIEGCRALGAELVLCESIHTAFTTMDKIAKNESRSIIHPFEGRSMSLGGATCGLEMFQDMPDMDIAILPVGGGGLISGISTALKLLNPEIGIYGVEPFGADSMFRSFQSGSPQCIEKVDTIADSLGSPTALPFSFALTKANVSDIVRVTDDELRDTMRLMNRGLKIMPEPACAASLAGAIGPLKSVCKGKKIALLACGSNISLEKFTHLTR